MARSHALLAAVATFALVAVACSDTSDTPTEISAEFTGDGCRYAGPTDFVVGDTFEVSVRDVTEKRMDVGFAVNKVIDGTTTALIEDQGIEEFFEEGAAEALLFTEVTEEGTDREMSLTFDVAGTWVVMCFSLRPRGFAATTLEVAEKS